MPVEFLTDEQAAAFGRFGGSPARVELERFFFLDDADRALIARRRAVHNRLGFALQLGTVRFLGTFLADPLDVPTPVVDFLAEQLEVLDASVVKVYAERPATQWEHTAEIRAVFGYRVFSDVGAGGGLREFLSARAWTRIEPSKVLFDVAVGWLREHRVLLPGVHALATLVAEVRTAAADRLCGLVAAAAVDTDAELPGRLDGLLVVPAGSRVSELERLRRAPTRVSGQAMVAALHRASELIGVGAGGLELSGVPANRLEALARDGLTSKAPVLRRRADARRTATLVATTRSLTAAAVDDALDLFGVLMATKLVRAAERTSRAQKLATLPRLRKASAVVAAATAVLLETLEQAEADQADQVDRADDVAAAAVTVDVAGMWAAVEQVVDREQLAAAVDTIGELAPAEDDDDGAWRAELVKRFAVVRPFLPLLAEVLPLAATAAGRPVLAALQALPELLGRKRLRAEEIRPELVVGSWRRLVTGNPDLPAGAVDRHAYVLCVLEALWRALRHREVYAVGSVRWGDPHAKLLDGPAWDRVRPSVLVGLKLPADAAEHLGEQAAVLDAAWRQLADRVGAGTAGGPGPDGAGGGAVRVDTGRDGRARLHLSPLGRAEEPPSLVALRELTGRMMPHVDLPELLLEVHARTGFLTEFTAAAGAEPRMAELEVSVAAVLIAEACNLGFKPVTRPGVAALTRSRLSHVEQNYVRAETLRAANARLIDAQAQVPLARLWGGGLVASIDGLRFVVPVATLYAGANPRYFGRRRGATWLNAINDQVAGIGAQVVPGTPRDSLFTLDVMLNPDNGRRPELVTSDTAGYSDMVFGLYRVCGMQYAPRLADLSDTRFWRLDPAADYGPLDGLARSRVRPEKIAAHWEQMLRIAGSLVTGQVRAYDLIRALGRDGNPTPLGQAFIEYGRIAKTLHLLAVIDPDDDTYRRALNAQLNVTESRHRLARKLFFGQRGELRQPYQEGQEDQLGALGLVLNAVVLWNTTYLHAALDQLRAGGHPVTDADATRLSPLGDTWINVHGSYAFTPPHLDGLRPLRDPAGAPEDEQ